MTFCLFARPFRLRGGDRRFLRFGGRASSNQPGERREFARARLWRLGKGSPVRRSDRAPTCSWGRRGPLDDGEIFEETAIAPRGPHSVPFVRIRPTTSAIRAAV